MKTEAIGNGVSLVHDSGVVSQKSAVDGDSFSMMLQAIFAARTQINQAPDSGFHNNPVAVSGERESIDEKEGESLQKWLAFAAFDGRFVENMELPVAGQELTAAEPKAAAAFALLLQQWDELPPNGQELVHLLLAGILEGGASSQGEQNTPGWLAELEMLAGAATAKTEPDLLMQAGANITAVLSGEAEALRKFGDEATAAKLPQSPQGQQLPEQLPQHLLERITALARPMEEMPVLEKQLGSAVAPPISEKGLSPQATTLVASYLQEGKPLIELPASLLSALRGHQEEMELSVKGEGGEKARPFEALLSRVEKFLSSLLSGGRGETGSETRQFGALAAEQQLKDSLAVLGENDSARMNAAFGGRAEMAAGTRSFASTTPAFHPNEVMAQVMERLAMLARPGAQELRMQLHPEHLGNMVVKLRNVRGVLSAEILTQHVAVKELLEGQLDTLRQRFQDMNIQVEEFRVLVGDEDQEKRGETGGSDKNPDIHAAAGLKQNNDLQHPAVALEIPRDMEQHRVDYLA